MFRIPSLCDSRLLSYFYWEGRRRQDHLRDRLDPFKNDVNTFIYLIILDADDSPLIENTTSGKDWISFTWKVPEERCRKYVSGIWVTINPWSGTSAHEMERFCPGAPIGNEFIAFNTSSPSFDEILYPCSDYTLEITLGSEKNKIGYSSQIDTMTTPGYDATAQVIENSYQFGINWISFTWSSSVRECQKFLTGYWINVTNVLVEEKFQLQYLNLNCSMKKPIFEIIFNSSLPCAQLEMLPCSGYSISITPEFLIDNSLVTGVSSDLLVGTESGETIHTVFTFKWKIQLIFVQQVNGVK